MKKAFTLIELLIVVAIIGILAAIAVPNFLNARARAAISRSEADMKALETALEMYFIDKKSYAESFRMNRLTSPVAYISSLPEDPFGPILESDCGYNTVVTQYGPPVKKIYIYHGPATFANSPGMKRHNIQYVITGLGPDRGWFDGPCGANNRFPRYASSNGLVSRGNFERVGPGNIPQKTYRDLWDNGL